MLSNLIERINELSRLARQRELTSEEQAERQKLRQEYLHAFRQQTREMLDNTYVQYPDGSRVALRDVNRKKK